MMSSHPQFLFATLCFITIFKSCIAADTLSSNQNLSDGEVLISPLQIFELGFFSPGSSTSRFLGIWYKATPDVVVWVANRQNPITGLTGVLTLSENGHLILTSSSPQGTIIWSSTSSSSPTPCVQLLDNGNLVVDGKNSPPFLWQSFDHPGDTRLPGMKMVNDPSTGLDKHLTSWRSPDDPSPGDFIYKIENDGLSQMTVVGQQKKYRSGPWDGTHFTGLPLVTYRDIESERGFSSDGKLISIVEAYSTSSIMRLTLSSSGSMQRCMMNEERDGWILAFSEPNDMCANYGWCGPNGICRAYKQPVCDCLRGFVPKSQREWNVMAWTSGCTRIQPLDCKKEDGFLKVERIKFPDTLNFQMNDKLSIDECREQCFRNCSCTAYADPYLSSEGSGCLMWFGDLIDVVEFTQELGTGPRIYIRVPISELVKKTRRPAKIVFAAASASFGMLVLCLCLGVVILRARRKRKAYKKKMEEFKLPLFGLATIAAATKNFSRENMIGKGGFGPVYKGNLSAEQVIAVKRLSTNSGQGAKEFKNEVTLIAQLQHRNLVRILGSMHQEIL